MLNLRDNFVLAYTKLRTRRIRLIVTLIVSGLLFSVLIVVSLVIHGLITSLESFTKEGFLDHYILNVGSTNYQQYNINEDAKVIDRAAAIHAETVAKKAAEAKRQGLSYDAAADPKPFQENMIEGQLRRSLEISHPAARQAIIELSDSASFDTNLTKITQDGGVIGVYRNFNYDSHWGLDFSLTPIIKGQEQSGDNTKDSFGPPDPILSFGNTLSTFDDAMMKPFLLKNTSLATKAGDAIPILAPLNAAESVLGVKALPAKATPEQQLKHLADLRTKASNFEFSVCYRNSTALTDQANAKAITQEVERRKNEAGYQMPALVYGAANEACLPPVVTRDIRPLAEKQAAEKQLAFNQQFGAPKPVVQKISFKIVGLLPQTQSFDNSLTLQAFATGILTPIFSNGWVMSHQAAETNPILKSIQNDQLLAAITPTNRFVEFKSRTDLQNFIDKYNCEPSIKGDCEKSTSFMAMPFGNPLIGLYEAGDSMKTAFAWLLGIIAGLSALIMMGTIGKVVADSRKETSVFRALGAKRTAIAQIYLLYTAILGLLTFGIACVAGITVALMIDHFTSGTLSVTAVLAFNAQDLHKQFHLIGWSVSDIAGIAGLVIVSSLASAILPLLGNVRRNPVKDMREE